MAARILKMNVMPRLIYPFQTLPIKLPRSYLNELVYTFVWVGKMLRLHRPILTLPQIRGGIGVPDPVRYYVASHLTRIMEWCVQIGTQTMG